MELNKQDFENYLRSMEPGDIAGKRFEEEHCPIANWCDCSVGPEGLMRHEDLRGVSTFWMPQWITRFVTAVDYLEAPDKEITASECLEILAGIDEE